MEEFIPEKAPPPVAPPGYEEYTTTIYHEELDATMVIHIMCACDQPAFKKIDSDHFKCLHCDVPCDVVDCQSCLNLEEFEGYDELQITEGDDDADL